MSAKSRIAREKRHRRVRSRISGTSERPRLNVFRSLNHIYAQLIDDSVGHTLASASTLDKKVAGQIGNKAKTEQAQIVGKLIAERARKAGINEVIFDRGGYRYHGRIKALADGAREGGLAF